MFGTMKGDILSIYCDGESFTQCIYFQNAHTCLQSAAYQARGGINFPLQMTRAFRTHKPTEKRVTGVRHLRNSRYLCCIQTNYSVRSLPQTQSKRKWKQRDFFRLSKIAPQSLQQYAMLPGAEIENHSTFCLEKLNLDYNVNTGFLKSRINFLRDTQFFYLKYGKSLTTQNAWQP
jgi:hypothetical protein